MAATPHAPAPVSGPAPTLRREWLFLGLSLLLLVGIVLPPLVNLGRYQHRIVDAMSRSLGRPVTMSAISLRLLPLPALVLSDVVVNEDPAFGAEPALRAPSVVAELRLTSLWRGRLEVSRVDLSEASLNLVRDAAGRWNIGSVLLQASHVTNAPTGQSRPGPAPRFPYIEITDSRLNVKQGTEKLPYSLLNANLSMWLAEPNLWQLKLEAQPVRTDLELGLSDTGVIRVEGTLHRATALGHMPLALHADWSNAPLGQASRLLLGQDNGWRGDMHASADVRGELDSLAFKSQLAITNLHREEFSPVEPFTVDATCMGAYSRAAQTISDLACRWPVGGGLLLLTGNVRMGAAAAPGSLAPTLAFDLRQVPAGFVVAAAGLARRDFATALHAEGALSGSLSYAAGGGRTAAFDGMIASPLLRFGEGDAALLVNDVRLSAAQPAPNGSPILLLTALPLDLGGASPVAVGGQLTARGFVLHAGGSAAMSRLEALGRGSRVWPRALERLAPVGTAEFDLTRSGSWRGEGDAGAAATERTGAPWSAAGAETSGWLRLRNAQYQAPFLRAPILLPSAQAAFTPGEIDWTIPSAILGHLTAQVSAGFPLGCEASPGCQPHFHLNLNSLDAGELAETLLGDAGQEPLLNQWISRLDAHRAAWPPVSGTVHADTFTLGRLTLLSADARLSITGEQVAIESLEAQALGGRLHSEGTVSLAGGRPAYALTTTLAHANAAAAGNVFRENWGSGLLALSSELNLAGRTTAELAASAQGKFHGEWDRGGLGGASGSGLGGGGGATPLARFASWTGEGTVGHSTLTLTRGELRGSLGTGGDPQTVTGTVGFDRALSLQIGGAGGAGVLVPVTGTLSHPSQ